MRYGSGTIRDKTRLVITRRAALTSWTTVRADEFHPSIAVMNRSRAIDFGDANLNALPIGFDGGATAGHSGGLHGGG